MCTAFLGPLLPDLQSQTSSGLSYVSLIFVGRGIGYALGSVTGSYLGIVVSHSGCIALAMGLLCVGVAVMPLVTNLAVLSFAVGLQGAAMAFVKSGGYSLIGRYIL